MNNEPLLFNDNFEEVTEPISVPKGQSIKTEDEEVTEFFDALKETLDYENPNDPLGDLVRKETKDKDGEIFDYIHKALSYNSDKISNLLEVKDRVSFFEEIAPIIQDEVMNSPESLKVYNIMDYRSLLHDVCFSLFNNTKIGRIYIVPKIVQKSDNTIDITDLYIYKY